MEPRTLYNVLELMEHPEAACDTLSQCRPMRPKLSPEDAIDSKKKMYNYARSFLDKAVEITITFIPVLQSNYHPMTLVDMIRTHFMTYKKRYDFKLVINGEYSNTGIFHMHGLLYCNDVRMYNSLRRKTTAKFGRFELKGIKYTESYLRYMFKMYSKDEQVIEWDEKLCASQECFEL